MNKVTIVAIVLAVALIAGYVIMPMLENGSTENVVDTLDEIEISEIRYICNAERTQSYPQVSGNTIVWSDYRNGNWDLYSYDLLDSAESRLTTNPVDEKVISVYGDKVTYCFYNTTSLQNDIGFYYLDNHTSAFTNAKDLYYSERYASGDSATYMAYRTGQTSKYISTPQSTPIIIPSYSTYNTVIGVYEELVLVSSYKYVETTHDSSIWIYTYYLNLYNMSSGTNKFIASATHIRDNSVSPQKYASGETVGYGSIIDYDTLVYGIRKVGGHDVDDYYTMDCDFYTYDLTTLTASKFLSDTGFVRATDGRNGLWGYTIQDTSYTEPMDMYLIELDSETIYTIPLASGHDKVMDISIYGNKIAISAQDVSVSSSEYLNIYLFTLSGEGIVDVDSDGDGMDDDWEQQIIDDDFDDDIQTIADVLPEEDYDGDGYTNLEEFENGTDPTVSDEDSDGDGYTDVEEEEAGTDPNDPDDMPDEETSASDIIADNAYLIIGIIAVVAVLFIVEASYYKMEHIKKINNRVNLGLIISVLVIVFIVLWWILTGV